MTAALAGRSRRARTGLLAAALGLALLAPDLADAGDRLRPLERERALSGIRARLHDAPARAAFDLEGERRRLRWAQIEHPRDPEPWRLERELQRLEWQADRVARTRARAQARADVGRERLPVPDYLRQPYETGLRAEAQPIGTGKLFLLIQRGLRDAAGALAAGRGTVAAARLGEAEARLGQLRARPEAQAAPDDPGIVAVEAELARVRAALAAAAG